jgi:PAS domain S-box-containing protein
MSAIVSEYWEEIINGIYTDVIISDSTGTIVYANNATDYWFHMAKEDLIGQSVFELERKRVFYPSITKKVLETKKKQTMIQDTKSGKKLLITGDIIYDQHKQIKYVVSYSQDVTDIEKLRAYVEEVESELQKVRNKLTILQNAQATSNPIIASSNQMKQILNTSMMVTNADISILITGETGVGKNVLARFIHETSGRKGSFIEVNCGSLPENLLESELFGYAPGAFTGAHPKGKKGLVEEAENGTLFLDEIGEMPLSLQVKLLTLIQEKKFFKIGESRPRYVNFRLIAATNVNLEKQVEEKSFREDLYYRLSVIPIYIPPLREREEDLSEMILAFKDKFNLLHKKRKEFHQQTIEHLLCYGWPGNVRELSNMVERLILTVDQSVILPEHLPDKVLMESYTNPLRKVGKSTLYEMLDELEVSILKKAMNECKSTTEMAKYLGVSQPTIVRKMQKYREFLEVKE